TIYDGVLTASGTGSIFVGSGVLVTAATVTGDGPIYLDECALSANTIVIGTDIVGPVVGHITIIAMGSGGVLTLPSLYSGAGTWQTTGTGALTLTAVIATGNAIWDLSSGVTVSGLMTITTFTFTFVGVSVTPALGFIV